MATAQRWRERARYAPPGVRLNGIAEALAGATALEPGGPSSLFGPHGLVPVYPQLAALDVLDFAERTLWSDEALALAGAKLRTRVIAEGGQLDQIADGAYDAVLASHVLEHLADPLGGLREWRRVVRPDGHILLIVPHRQGTFDHRRPVTTLEHMQADAERRTGEDDLTHLDEIIQLHDLRRDPGRNTPEGFAERCRNNFTIRGMHHHVFVARTVVELCRAAELNVVALATRRPFHIVCLCTTGDGAGRPTLGEGELDDVLRGSVFSEDHAFVEARPS